MARFKMELPNDVMKDIKKIHDNTDKIFGEMTKAGAEVAADNIRGSLPEGIPPSAIKVSRQYKTPSDDGINTKVYVSGYKSESKGWTRRGRATNDYQYFTHKGIPFEFIVKVLEYGTSPRFTNNGAYRGYIGKKPFFRKGFSKDQIKAIMLKVQKRESGGLLS